MQHRLTDTLVLRTVRDQGDVDQIIALNSEVHSETDEPDPKIGVWTSQLLDGTHPVVTRDDFTVVEDTTTGQIVSTLCLIPQTWAYDGIPFGVGRIELVGTHRDYRRRGLIRAQFEVIHERCAELGLPVQGITGIPYYYRRFGYEYALNLLGARGLGTSSLPETPTGTPFTLREWKPADLPRLQALHDAFARDKLVTCPRSLEQWRHRFGDTDPDSIYAHWLMVITRQDDVIGYLTTAAYPWKCKRGLVVDEMVLDVSYPAVVPWLIPRLRDETAARFPDVDPSVSQIMFYLGRDHPLYPYLRPYRPHKRRPYAWYIRVPDLAGFVRHIAPALERRVASGALAGLTRTLTLNFYTGGLSLDFEEGRLAAVEDLPPGMGEGEGDWAFPPLVFLQLLFGYRSLSELAYAFPDASGKPEARPILDELFPKRLSWVREMY
jgi:GNAT superfamily N-acetyltransferase